MDRSTVTAGEDAHDDRAVAALRELLAGVHAADRSGEEAEAVLRESVAIVLRSAFLLHAEALGRIAGEPSLSALIERIGGEAERARDHRSQATRELAAALRTAGGLDRGLGLLEGGLDDAAVARALRCLGFARGARIAYGELAIDELGGVREALVGFGVRVAVGRSVTLAPDDTIVDLDALLAAPPEARVERLAEQARCSLRARAADAVAAARTVDALHAALAKRISPVAAGAGRSLPTKPGGLMLAPTAARRRAGAHYTPARLAGEVVHATLAPLLGDDPSPEQILALRVCDPAMGSGAFLLEVCRYLADRLLAAEEARGGASPDPDRARSRRAIASRCLHGVDKDPLAVDAARLSLWLLTRADPEDPPDPLHFLEHELLQGDSLLGGTDGTIEPELAGHAFFHWDQSFPEVLGRGGAGGFDAIVGNPPWVAFAGRAAQPLAPELHRHFQRTSPAFFGYRTLHGLFVHRAATLLRPGGRLGLILPTSVADLGGYEPTRVAHDRLCEPDAELPDFGSDAFDGVFQPAMALLSTRRAAERAPPRAPAAWTLARSDLAPPAAALLARLSALAPLPADLFGERGFQTTGDDVHKLRAAARPEPPHTIPLREGRDLGSFIARAPRLHLDPRELTGYLRPPAHWHAVKLLIRQTARYPIAALADGIAFRNSILAGFAAGPYSEFLLLAYLNSAPVRWFHFARHRDARQGMPQVKIGHLRAIPAPIEQDATSELDTLGRALGLANRGATPDDCARIDALAARALALAPAELDLVRAWATENPPPRSLDDR